MACHCTRRRGAHGQRLPYRRTVLARCQLDLPRLIDDDLFAPIKLLFKNGFYVSAAKLFLVNIDTLSFLESGESSGGTFRGWLERYCDLGPLGITAEELWEWRNGMLHMSNLESRKVKAEKVRRLFLVVGNLPAEAPNEIAEGRFLNFLMLIKVVADGFARHLEAMNRDRNPLMMFLERYDLVIADQRLLRLAVG